MFLKEGKERPVLGKGLVLQDFQMHKIHSNPRLRQGGPCLGKAKLSWNPPSLRQTVQLKKSWGRQDNASLENNT